MSAYSTLYITRSKAKELVMRNLFENMENDDWLQQQVDVVLEPRLFNCRIVSDNDEDNNDDLV